MLYQLNHFFVLATILFASDFLVMKRRTVKLLILSPPLSLYICVCVRVCVCVCVLVILMRIFVARPYTHTRRHLFLRNVRSSSGKRYHRRKWTRWLEFKSWAKLSAFHIAQIRLERNAANYLPSIYGYRVEQTELFNFGMAASLGEEKLWIQTC